MAKRTHRVAWGLTAALAALVVLLWPLYPMWRAQWVAKTRGQGADLAGAQFGMASLVEVDLRDANLQGASLGKSKCFDADFRGANLSRANLSGAFLAGADFRGANLTGIVMNRAAYDQTTR